MPRHRDRRTDRPADSQPPSALRLCHLPRPRAVTASLDIYISNLRTVRTAYDLSVNVEGHSMKCLCYSALTAILFMLVPSQRFCSCYNALTAILFMLVPSQRFSSCYSALTAILKDRRPPHIEMTQTRSSFSQNNRPAICIVKTELR
jgi:hypothetical protein